MPETAAFDGLAREFFSGWFRFHPEAALTTGVGDYGGLPAPQSDDDQAALGSLLETVIVALQELDHDALDPARRLDAERLAALAAVEHRELLERDWRHRDPLRFLPLAEIHRLTLLAPPALRDDLLSLLGAVPAHLRLAITQLTPMAELIPPPLVAAAIRAAEAGPAYLRELVRSRWLQAHCHGTGELEAAAETAATSLRQYAAALTEAIAPRAVGRYGCGAEHLAFLLHHRHGLAVQPAQCAPMLERLDKALASEPPGHDQAASAAVQDGLAGECGRQRTLLDACGLVSPPAAPLRVAAGPACPRPGVMGMVGLDAEGIDYVPNLIRGEGTLYLATGTPCATAAESAELALPCLGLGWGGLHTLIFAGGMAARSLPRLLGGGTSLRHGWPLALASLAFADGPAARSARAAQRAAVAAARLELDLHLGRIDRPEALTRAARLGDTDCVLAALLRNPGDALAAVLGWQLISATQATLAADPAAMRDFHVQLVTQGPIPASTAVAAARGEAHVRTVLAELCAAHKAPA